MTESDKDGRIARWLYEQHAILGMEIAESLCERTDAGERAGLKHRTSAGGQCDYAEASEGSPRPNTCPECPPVLCPDCGGEDDLRCACWISLEGLPLAEIKGLLALGGLSVETPARDAD